MDDALDEIAFLASSENRVAVFETLVDAPRDRHEILEEVDASRVTITRALRELESRGWITGTGQAYAVTPSGEWVCEAFVRLVDEMAAENRLRGPLQWFPSELLTFDVQCLRDADVVLVDRSDATAFVRRVVEFHRSGERIQGVTRVTAPVLVENHWELTVRGDTRLEMVVTPEVLDAVGSHPESARLVREMLDEPNVRLSVSDGVPMTVGVVDDCVGINLTDDAGVIKGGLLSDDETVHEWAVDLIEDCRDRARPMSPEELTP